MSPRLHRSEVRPGTVLVTHYRNTLSRVVAIVYTGGTIAQSLQLVLAFGWESIPFWVDWALVVLGSYGGVGLLLFTNSIAWRGRWEKVVHGLIVAHLLTSVVLHAGVIAVGNHDLFATFPYEYSYFAVAYFALFAWRSWTMKMVTG